MTKGWCPVHDRIVEGRDGTCPECGTPLVDLTARPRHEAEARLVVEQEAPEPEPEPIAVEIPPATETSLWPEIALPQRLFGRETITIGPVAIATVVVGAVLAAFLLGLAIPRSRGTKTEAVATPQMRADRRLGLDRTGAGVRLKLERFSQRGTRVVLRVTVPDQPGVDIGLITGATVAPEVAGGTVIDAVPLEVRTTVTGFIAEGSLLERPDVPIVGVRILALDVTIHGSGRARLDLSRVWGRARRGPIASDRRADVRLSGRTARVVGLVGWPDHLEIRIENRSGHPEWTYGDQYRMAAGEAEPTDGEVISVLPATGGGSLLTISFNDCDALGERCLPRGISPATLIIEPQTATIQGDWRWQVG